MLTCALRTHVKQPKKNDFALENTIWQFLRSWIHVFWYVYLYKLTFA